MLDSGKAATVTPWVEEVATAVGATVLVSDDADAFQTAAAAGGRDHQVGPAHVVRTTEAWGTAMGPVLEADAEGSLAAIAVASAQAVADAKEVLRLIQARDPTPKAAASLQPIHRRYLTAPPPRPGARATLAYRVRLFSLDRWTLWSRLTRDRTWEGPDGERWDGTTNGGERAIGWWVTERDRSMRGDQRQASVLNLSRLIAWRGKAVGGPGADLALLSQSGLVGRGAAPSPLPGILTEPRSEQSQR